MANVSDQPLSYSPVGSHLSLAPEETPAAAVAGPSATSATSAQTAASNSALNEELRRRPGRAVTVDAQHGGSRKATGESGHRSRSEPAPSAAAVLRKVTTSLFTPERPVAPAPGWLASFKAAICSSWVNVLLVFIPVGWALHFVKSGGNHSISDTVVFVMTFISIIPLAGLLGFATEEISMRLGETLGGLVNATLGNVVELIVAIIALIKCEIDVVQSSLVGSMLSNLLLVLGMCFIAGGFKYAEQSMKETASQLNMSLLLIAVCAVLVPSAFHFAFSRTDGSSDEEKKDLLNMSHGVAVILLALYVFFMLFQMWTHSDLYSDDAPGIESTRYRPEIANLPGRARRRARRMANFRSKKRDEEQAEGDEEKSRSVVEGEGVVGEATSNGTAVPREGSVHSSASSEEEEEVPQMNMPVTIIVMVIVAVLVGVTAEFLVDSINGMVESNPSLSAEWVGLILLPIVGNAAEHFTAISVAVKDKLDLAISVAVGSSIQIALFVIPICQLLAWCINKPMTLLFDPFESVMLFFTVIIVNQTMADGRSNWMEGMVLVFFYLIIAVSFWFYPGSDPIISCK